MSALPQGKRRERKRIGVYIHWPFCLSKCPYCDFNSHVHKSIDHVLWQESYLKAIGHYAQMLPDVEVISIYFGGGTPSLMDPETIEALISKIQKSWRISNDIEITLEANPTSVESGKFESFKKAGINRVSLGVQALNDKDLKFLGREHSVKEALQALDIVRENFERFSFDLIYARPEQSLKAWKEELKEALAYARGHLSLYQLTIERGTPFYMDHAQGKFSIPEDGLAADFYHLTQDMMEDAGLPAYEVSNHAAKFQESQHNLIYWHYGDYIGIGPGAHGRIMLMEQKQATRDHNVPQIWLNRVAEAGCGADPFTALSAQDQFFEGLMMGLRVRGGVSLERLSQVSGVDWRSQIDEVRLQETLTQGWVIFDDEHLRLTREGWLRLNAILPYILK